MATKDFQELIKAQQETTKALMSSEDAAKYDTILTEKQFEFDKKSEAAKQGAETKRVNAAAAAEAKKGDDKAAAAKEAADAAKESKKTKSKETKVANATAAKIAAAVEVTKKLTATSLGMSVKSLEERQGRSEELKGQSKQLENLREVLEVGGGKAEDSLKFNKLQYQLKKAELAERLKNATSPSAKKEIRNEQRALAAKQEGLLGKIAGGINFLRDSAKEKLKTAGKGIMAILGTLAIAGFALALVAFLNSKYWGLTKKYIKKTLVPSIKRFYNAFFGPKGGFTEGFSELFGDKTGIGHIIAGLLGAAALFGAYKFIKLAMAVKGLLGRVTDFASKLTGIGGGKGGGKGVLSKTTGGGSAAGKFKGGKKGGFFGQGIANIGKGLGKGLGGIFKGLAAGLMAFANPAVAIGAAVFAAAIVLIGGAVAGASYLLGKAMPTMAEGFKSFESLNGLKLMEVGKGIAALGAGMAAFGAGKAVGAVGGLIGSIAGFFGGGGKLTPLEQLKIFSDTKINAVQATANAKGLVSYSKAMSMAGGSQAAVGIGGVISGITDSVLGWMGKDNPLEKFKKFGDMDINASGIMKNSKAVAEYSKAMSLLKGDITGVDLINAERANRVNRAGVERSGGGGGTPIIVHAPSTNVSSNSSSSSTFTNTPMKNNNPTVNALNYSF